MGVLGWLRRKVSRNGDAELAKWRAAWRAASAAPDTAQLDALTTRLHELNKNTEDVEIEHEMLDGLAQLAELTSAVESTGLPVLETGHRLVGSDLCHFSAPVSVPDDPSQPTGRLLLTSGRAIFVGGARATTMAWHSVADVVHSDRDLVLIRQDRETLHRFRCNSFGEAMRGAFLARRLSGQNSGRNPR